MADEERRRAGSYARDPGAGLRRVSSVTGMTSNGGPLIVMKVGTSSLIDNSGENGLIVRLCNLGRIVDLIASLVRAGHRVVLVSSGAVGMGCIKLGLKRKPSSLTVKQAVAAAGQSQLMRSYEELFGMVQMHVAQLLLSQSDFTDKGRWRNVRSTIDECLMLGLLPIINENDSTSTSELRFGDNDNLAALTAVQLRADWLFLLTDVDYLYSGNPVTDPTATPFRVVDEAWSLQVTTSTSDASLGTGGMATKIIAFRTAAAAGITCGLVNGAEPERIHSFLSYAVGDPEPYGTLFQAAKVAKTMTTNRCWLLSLPVSGDIIVDEGAARAVARNNSLLPAGVTAVHGNFLNNETVRIMCWDQEIARAIATLSAAELEVLGGKQSSDFAALLGYSCSAEACHRSNIILMATPEVVLERSEATVPQSGEASPAPPTE
eukprot:NODE_4894_length_1833_cov_11.770809.p1 GENE.NODE_4894_length_1833_cov_11.770809~~NODE_4894_length_1833_cov_11.770809.p1  ORF type:complete len:433 (-),score=138.07 NODE_4894_length_1833_cov_11.770809:370-1668(-)